MNQISEFRSNFYQKLPHKPYCSDDLGGGVIIRPKRTAIQMQYIQHNPPCLVSSLVFDIDRPDAYFSWSDANLPPPHWIARNRQNSHAHMGYILSAPVCTSDNARQKAITYLAKIQRAYITALDADRGYSGLITKNPCHNAWETHLFDVLPYDLGYLADFVELEELPTAPKEVSGLGRNCAMFDTARKWAYTAVRAHRGGVYNTWLEEVTKQCLSVNEAFLEALLYSEIKATAKSIAEYCWKKDAYCYQEFVDRQSRKGAIGGKKSKRLPVDGSEASTKPWESMGISRATFYRRKNETG